VAEKVVQEVDAIYFPVPSVVLCDYNKRANDRPLPSALRLAVALNNRFFKSLTMRRLLLCPRNDALGASCESFVITLLRWW
jgi:hypothetical protein